MRKRERSKTEGSYWWHIRGMQDLLRVQIVTIINHITAVVYSPEMLDSRFVVDLSSMHETKQDAIDAEVKRIIFRKECELAEANRHRAQARHYDKDIAELKKLKPYKREKDA